MELPYRGSATPLFLLHFIKTITLLLLFCSVSSGYGSFGGNETDQEALLEFKSKLSDPLGVMGSWNSSVHFCGWYGVTCGSTHQRVTVLSLQSSKLSGTISPYIGNLSFLRELHLDNNGFHSEIPREISRLSRLQKLSLMNNSLSGPIPSNLSYCPNLSLIDLGYNMLEGNLPPELGSLSNLLGIFLRDNRITGTIPRSFGNMTSLKLIQMPQNNLGGEIPDTLGKLRNLKYLILWVNNFTGTIPVSIFNISALKLINLSENQLEGSLPPSSSFNLPNLEQIGLSSNQLSGHIPDSISNSSNLLMFEIVFNHFTGKIPSFQKMTNLEVFNIGVNQFGNGQTDELNFLCSLTNSRALDLLAIESNAFGGQIPECIGNLSTTLQYLGISNNSLSGSLPASIGKFVNLEIFNMYATNISGNISPEIGNLRKLQVLNLGKNKLSGQIPDALGNLTMLTKLYLQSNRLQGIVPWTLSNCKSLLLLDISDNQLSGAIPPQIMSLSSLSIYADLSQNNFSGELPAEVGNLKNLGELRLNGNQLSGKIPTSLGSCINLESLYMQDNLFEGSIPSSFSSLKGIQVLNLSHNRLTGQIPEFLVKLPLTELGLAFNEFDGILPTEGVFANASSISVIGNEKLCGGLSKFDLPKCNTKESRRKKSTNTVRTILISTGFGLLGIASLLFILYIFCFKKERRAHESNYSNNELLKVSYQNLLKATDGFSSTNLIGVGSFGSVYKGVFYWHKGNVAIKVLNLSRHGATKSFIAECEALRNVRHRNLVKVLTACSGSDYQGNDFKALIYEFMVNGSLDEWLHPVAGPNSSTVKAQRNLSLLQRLNIAIDVACALGYLHEQYEVPVVHCDLKPSNVLLDDEMVGHVGDFGLVRFLPDVTHKLITQQTSSIGVKGSFGYIAPEYGAGSEVSTYGDVYSFGILVLEMFTGKRPTDDMFRDGMNIHCFAKATLPDQVEQIIDPMLVQEIEDSETDIRAHAERFHKIQECLASILEIGVICSSEIPRDRMSISKVVTALQVIRNKLAESGI